MPKTIIMSNSATRHLFDALTDPELIKMKSKLIVKQFSDGEMSATPEDSVRGGIVYLFGDTSHNIMELMCSLDSLCRSSVKAITVVLPYFGYGRQDKRKNTRGSLGAKVVANMISMFPKVERVVTFDIHSDQTRGFFDIPVENVQGHSIFVPELKKLDLTNTKLVSPDAGGAERTTIMAEKLDLEMVRMEKYRKKANEIDKHVLIGDVKGYNVILIDDMGDTLGTMESAISILKEKGAQKVSAVFTHPVLSGKGQDRIFNLGADRIFMSDTIQQHVNFIQYSPSINVVSCVPVLQRAIKELISDGSISSLNM